MISRGLGRSFSGRCILCLLHRILEMLSAALRVQRLCLRVEDRFRSEFFYKRTWAPPLSTSLFSPPLPFFSFSSQADGRSLTVLPCPTRASLSGVIDDRGASKIRKPSLFVVRPRFSGLSFLFPPAQGLPMTCIFCKAVAARIRGAGFPVFSFLEFSLTCHPTAAATTPNRPSRTGCTFSRQPAGPSFLESPKARSDYASL